MKTKLVIFDLDGTLLNSVADLATAANQALEKLGFPLRTEEACRSFVGNGVGKLLERALPQGYKTEEWLQKLRPIFFDYYDQHLWDHTLPYEGISSLLETLQNQGVLMGIASNKYQTATERLARHFFPQVRFSGILGQREGIPVKPDPQIVEELVSLSAVDKETVLYVGDSEVDVQTAKNAKVKVCAVTWGFRSCEELLSFSPDFVISHPKELLDIV